MAFEEAIKSCISQRDPSIGSGSVLVNVLSVYVDIRSSCLSHVDVQ